MAVFRRYFISNCQGKLCGGIVKKHVLTSVILCLSLTCICMPGACEENAGTEEHSFCESARADTAITRVGPPWPAVLDVPKVTGIKPDSISLEWSILSTFNQSTHYQVMLNHTLIGASTQNNSATVSGITPGTKYRVTIVTYHNGEVAGVSSHTDVLTCPAMPTDLMATAIGTTTISLHWYAVDTATQYRVYRKGGILLGSTESNQTNLTVSGLTPGETLSIYVVAVNASGESYHSKTLTIVMKPEPPPLELVVDEIAQTSFLVRWEKAEGAQNYSLLLNGEVNTTVGSETLEYRVTDLTPGASYTCSIRSENESGVSEPSPEIKVLLVPANPIKPVASDISSYSVTILWSPVVGAERYKIYVNADWLVANIEAPLASVSLNSGFIPGETATFTVVARNSSGDSGHSEGLCVTFTGTEAPPARIRPVIYDSGDVRLSMQDSLLPDCEFGLDAGFNCRNAYAASFGRIVRRFPSILIVCPYDMNWNTVDELFELRAIPGISEWDKAVICHRGRGIPAARLEKNGFILVYSDTSLLLERLSKDKSILRLMLIESVSEIRAAGSLQLTGRAGEIRRFLRSAIEKCLQNRRFDRLHNPEGHYRKP